MANRNFNQCKQCIGFGICRDTVNPNEYSCNRFADALEAVKTSHNKLQAAIALLVRCESSFSASGMERKLKQDIRKFINEA